MPFAVSGILVMTNIQAIGPCNHICFIKASSDRHNPQVESIHYDRYSKAL